MKKPMQMMGKGMQAVKGWQKNAQKRPGASKYGSMGMDPVNAGKAGIGLPNPSATRTMGGLSTSALGSALKKY